MKYGLNTGVKFNLENMGMKAQRIGAYAVEMIGVENPMIFVGRNEEVALVYSRGAVRMSLHDAEIIARDLMDIVKDYKDFRREERRIV